MFNQCANIEVKNQAGQIGTLNTLGLRSCVEMEVSEHFESIGYRVMAANDITFWYQPERQGLRVGDRMG